MEVVTTSTSVSHPLAAEALVLERRSVSLLLVVLDVFVDVRSLKYLKEA